MSGKILFICGTLEAGKDGVGDYTRRLAGELRSRGLTVHLLASHDKQITELLRADDTLRIPYSASASDRMSLLREVIVGFRPDLISLQYVPYSFNNRGVPLAFVRELKELRSLGRWHVMFHELWIDERGFATPKNTAISLLQRWSAKTLVGSLNPALCHTHLPAYQDKLLKKTNIPTRPLPLFANIAPALAAQKNNTRQTIFRIGFFSQMDLVPEVLNFVGQLHEWLKKDRRQLEILLLGGSATKVENTALELNRNFPEAIIKPLGFMAEEELSKQLFMLDLGITPVRYHAIGKSGTVAAFLSHRIPVAAPWVTESGLSFFDSTLTEATLTAFSPTALARATLAAKDLDLRAISVTGVADRFLADFGFTPAAANPTL